MAGLGTRFLPVTKATPKEMLPIANKPLIQYAVEEAIEAGIEELIFVTCNRKQAIADYFTSDRALETLLEKEGKTALLSMVQAILPKHVHCVYVVQDQPLGLGHAVLCARQLINDESFAVILADDLIAPGPASGCLQAMVELFTPRQSMVLAVEEVPKNETKNYGIVSLAENNQINTIVEKPAPDKAPSNLAVVGRYILHSDIFAVLESTAPGAKGEIQLTDAIVQLLKTHPAYALHLQGLRFDCGSELGYLQATVHFGLEQPELGPIFKRYLLDRIGGVVE